MKCMAWSRSLEWNTDPIETAELEDLIGQTSHCMYSCEDHHAHELAEAHRWTVSHDWMPSTWRMQRLCWSNERLTCRANLRLTTRLSNRGSQWRVLRYTYIHTPLDDSRPSNKSGSDTLPLRNRSDFKQALSTLERLHHEAGEEPYVPTYSNRHKQWQLAQSSSSTWWNWQDSWWSS